MIDSYENYTQIDDIIDARKKLGQYNVHKQSSPINYRYAYSSSATTSDNKFIKFDDSVMISEGDYFNNTSDVKSSDSEITVVRVRCDGLQFKRKPSKWDMHDIAIPGDGTHLGESPSMVNLATLVQQNDEYLVPLSSWEPVGNKNEEQTNESSKDEDSSKSYSTVSQISEESRNSNSSDRRSSLAGRISKFIRRHYKRSKVPPEPLYTSSKASPPK